MSRKAGFYLAFVCLLLMIVSAVSWAQETTPNALPPEIAYNTPVQGTIDNTNFTASWSLLTASADRVAVRIERTGGTLIPTVSILDTNNQVLSQSRTSQDYASATIDSFKLPNAGEYVIRAGRDRADKGATTGTFTLTVIPLATADDNPQNTTIVGPILADTPLTGEITATHWYQRYTYDAQAGDTIEIQAQRTSGTLFPEVEVLDVNGSSLSTGYTNNTGDSADAVTTLPAKGQYTIAMTRANRYNGDSLGGYELTVALRGSGEGSPNLLPLAGNVEYNQELPGKITGARWYEDWQLTAQAGDTIRVTVQRADGNLVPEVAVLGGAGQNLGSASADTHGDSVGLQAQIEHVKLRGPGTYTVRVSRVNEQRGVTTGSYKLIVALLGSGAGSPNLTTPSGAITLETPVSGSLTGTRWMDSWTFDKPDDQPLYVTMQRTDGTLMPVIEIRDLNGQSLRTANPEPTQDHAILKLSMKAGNYLLIASRVNGQDGYTTGGYTMTVSATPPQ